MQRLQFAAWWSDSVRSRSRAIRTWPLSGPLIEPGEKRPLAMSSSRRVGNIERTDGRLEASILLFDFVGCAVV